MNIYFFGTHCGTKRRCVGAIDASTQKVRCSLPDALNHDYFEKGVPADNAWKIVREWLCPELEQKRVEIDREVARRHLAQQGDDVLQGDTTMSRDERAERQLLWLDRRCGASV